MIDPPAWASLSGSQWQQRIREAEVIRNRWAFPHPDDEDDEEAKSWLAGIDPSAYVGARHHTVRGSCSRDGQIETARSASTTASRAGTASRTFGTLP
jgi:hypothetical protein